jgi:hypothetical protein
MTSERVWRILKPPAKIIPQRVPPNDQRQPPATHLIDNRQN